MDIIIKTLKKCDSTGNDNHIIKYCILGWNFFSLSAINIAKFDDERLKNSARKKKRNG